jgi:hypothetical protein
MLLRTFHRPSSGQWARVSEEADGWRIEFLTDEPPIGFVPNAFCTDFEEAALRLSAAGYVPLRTVFDPEGELIGILEGEVIKLNTGEQWLVSDGRVFRPRVAGVHECVGEIRDRVICMIDGCVLYKLDEPQQSLPGAVIHGEM